MSGTSGTPPDPLDNLIDRVRADVKVAYADDVIEALVELKRSDLGAYVDIYNQLKTVPGFIAGDFNQKLNQVWADTSALMGGEPDDTAMLLIKLAQSASYFIDADGEDAYAELTINGHRAVASLHSKRFKRWLIDQYYVTYARAPARETVKTALDTLEAKAFRDNVCFPLFVRVGHHDGKVYIDRGTDEWDAIEVDAGGWRVMSQAPVKFLRPAAGIGTLPIPAPGGDIERLGDFLNLQDRRDFVLYVGWIISCYGPEKGQYGLLLLLGPHGSAKTSSMRLACALIDPIRTEPMGQPREDRDVLIIAQETFVMPMDNVKHISLERSSVYCRLLSGASHRARSLYTDKDTMSVAARRPIAMTSTTLVVTEEDLSDRAVIVRTGSTLGKNDGGRKQRAQLDAEFAAAWPQLFGCILNAISAGLRNRDMEPPNDLPRLADLAVWLHRCETGLGWAQGTIMASLQEGITEAAEDLADHDVTASAMLSFMADKTTWGPKPISELLRLLRRKVPDRIAHSKDWPASASALSRRLGELRVVLQRNNLLLEWGRTNRAKTLTIVAVTNQPRPNGAGTSAANDDDDPGEESPTDPKPQSWRPAP